MQSNRPNQARPSGIACLILASALAGLLVSGCRQSQSAPKAAPAALEAHVRTIEPQTVTLTTELPGRTSAYRVSEVRARINGIVQKRLFTEGTDVKAGDVLFEIDPAPYQAAFDSAKATLARAEASLFAAEAQAQRFKGLVGSDAISRQTYDDAEANRLARAADVAAAQAALQAAEINLGYTRVTAPISGRIGRAAVTEGAYVQQGTATLLATIQQLNPLYIDLNQSADDALQLKQAIADGQLSRSGQGSASLTVLLNNDTAYARTGTLEFSDVSVSPTTGTVTLRGTVPNPNLDLLPGMFVKARIDQGTKSDAILVPQTAVSRDGAGNATVLVVGEGDKVEMRTLQVDRMVGPDWLVSAGLNVGDRVILDNRQKLRPGMPVKPLPAETAAQ